MDQIEQRLRRLEEALGFSEHDAESRGREVAELSKQVFDLTQRVERLERRLDQAIERLPPPPGGSEAQAEPNAASGEPSIEQ